MDGLLLIPLILLPYLIMARIIKNASGTIEQMPKKFFGRNKQQKGVYAFIDSQNLNLGTQKVGWKMDWKKLLEYLKTQQGVTRAFLFIGYLQEHETMYEGLHDMGYSVVLKPTVSGLTPEDQKPDAKDDHGVKGNVDTELVLYAMKELPNYSSAIIISGDGDFYCLAEYLAGKDRLKAIMTPNKFYSSLLSPYEKFIIRIDEMREQLAYKDHRPRRRGKGKKH